MGRSPCSLNAGLNRGPWTLEEDFRLTNYVEAHGEGGWTTLPKKAGLLRCGKSCRLRWMNYLRPDVKRGHILLEEEDLILRLHRLLGNRWSLIAGRMPGRTDNEIKNYWNTHLSKKLLSQGIDPRTHKPLPESQDVMCSSPVDSETRQKSKQDKKMTTIPGNYIQESRADVQDEASNGETIAADHGNEDQAAATSLPANKANNEFREPSLISNCQPVSVLINISPQSPLISSTAFQESSSTCVPEAVSNPVDMNHDKGSKQISFPLNSTACFSRSEQLPGVDRYDLDQYLMNKPVMSSNDMIAASTVRLSSASQSAPLVGQFDSNHDFISRNALLNEKHHMSQLQSLQTLEINPQHSFTVYPCEEATYNKLSHTSCAVPDRITASCSYPYPSVPTAMGAALVDFNSDIFPSLLDSFGSEELQLEEPDAQTSVAQNVQLIPSIQPKAESLASYDLWSMLSPIPQYHHHYG